MGKKQFDEELIEKIELSEMYEISLVMLRDVIVAYSENDSRLARTVFSTDLQLNRINHDALSIVVNYCKAGNENIEQALHLLSIIHKLERVGDHVTNIAEEIIFFKEARILKHGNKGGDHTSDK
ncbi:MAG: PhoU domain-containing protein [Segetibacter sp.]